MPPKERKGPAARRGDTKPDGRQDVRIPSSGAPGNRKADQAWGKEQNDLGHFERIGPDELGIPFGAKYRWLFLQEELEEEFFKSKSANPCEARSYIRDRDGRYILDADNAVLTRPCMRDAIRGSHVCYNHGGSLPATKRAARARLEGTSDLVVERLLAIAMDAEADPKVVVAACNSLLDRAGVKGGMDIDITGPGWQAGLRDLLDGKYENDQED
jgi:hypothetical protein